VNVYVYFQAKLVYTKKFLKTRYIADLDHANFFPGFQNGSLHHCNLSRSQDEYTLGHLHYHYRNLTLTALRAFYDMKGFGYLYPDATFENFKKYIGDYQYVEKHRLAGSHKARELMDYAQSGPHGILSAANKVYHGHSKPFTYLNVQEITALINST
jgi:hypothetical protein